MREIYRRMLTAIMTAVIVVGSVAFSSIKAYAVTDYDGNGIITQDEKQKYYKEVWGIDPYAPGGVEQYCK